MKTYGQIGYEAYRAHTGGVSLATGAPIPEWDALPQAIKAAWEAAGMVVAKHMLRTAAADVEDYGRKWPNARVVSQRIAQGLREGTDG